MNENLDQKSNNIEADYEQVVGNVSSAIRVLLDNVPEEKYTELKEAFLNFAWHLREDNYGQIPSSPEITPEVKIRKYNQVIKILYDPFARK